MADNLQHLRAMPFDVVAPVLGIDLKRFRHTRKNWQGACPVHNPKTNMTSFGYADDGRFSCFSCAIKGSGIIDLVKLVRQCNFTEATAWLEQNFGAGYQVPPGSESHVLGHPGAAGKASKKPFDPSKLKYHKYFRSPHAWLEARGLSLETCERYGVGYYENPARKSIYNCSVMIPFREFETGELAGYLSRNIGEVTADRPKYRMPAGFEKSRFLFGSWEIKQTAGKLPVKVLFVVESPFTVCKFHQLGFDCVAAYGWSLSENQIGLLTNLARGLVLLPDSDKRDQLLQSRFDALLGHSWVKVPRLPDGCGDPETLQPEQIRALLA